MAEDKKEESKEEVTEKPKEDIKVGRANIENWEKKIHVPRVTTRGDANSCPCPYCGRDNPTIKDKDDPDKYLVTALPYLSEYFERTCGHCGSVILYKAEYVLTVVAKVPKAKAE